MRDKGRRSPATSSKTRGRPAVAAGIFIATIALVVGLGGCTTSGEITVRSRLAFGRSLDELGPAWDWSLVDVGQTGNTRIERADADQLVRAAIERELGARGYRRATTEGPSFLVALQLGRDLWVDGFDDAGPRQTEEGTLSVSVVDPGSQTVIWRSTARAPLPAGRDARTATIEEAVRRLVAELPTQTDTPADRE